MSLADEIIAKVDERIKNESRNVILVRNDDAPYDVVDIRDEGSNEIIARNISEESAREFKIIWNGMISNGESAESLRKINLAWLTEGRKNY